MWHTYILVPEEKLCDGLENSQNFFHNLYQGEQQQTFLPEQKATVITYSPCHCTQTVTCISGFKGRPQM